MSGDFARMLRKNMTDAERKIWSRLRCRQLLGRRFRRQAPLGPFIADFACFEAKLIVELDGGQHLEQATYDAERTRWFEVQGFKVVRFWDHEALTQTESVIEAITRELEREPCPPSLTLPHAIAGGGESRDWSAASALAKASVRATRRALDASVGRPAAESFLGDRDRESGCDGT